MLVISPATLGKMITDALPPDLPRTAYTADRVGSLIRPIYEEDACLEHVFIRGLSEASRDSRLIYAVA